MPQPSNLPARGGAARDTKQVDLLISLARDEMAETFKTADALEAKARSVQQLSTIFFAASQVAAGLLVASGTAGVPKGVAIAAGALGLGALVAVAISAFLTMRLHEPSDQKAFDLGGLETKLLGFAEKNHPQVPRFVFGELRIIVEDRREKNKKKAGKVDRVLTVAYTALALSALQVAMGIVYTFIAR